MPRPATHHHAYLSNGREWELQKRIEAWFWAQACTVRVQREMRLAQFGPPPQWLKDRGSLGNLRPDLIVWCNHNEPYPSHINVVEVKAGTACTKDLAQLSTYLEYLRFDLGGFVLIGTIMAPELCTRAWIPEGIRYRATYTQPPLVALT